MRTAVAVLACSLALSSVVRADDFADAQRYEAALDYEHALALVNGILARGGADPARLAELHLAAGRLAAGLGQARIAEDHFARALAIQPDIRLAAGTSPKLTQPFQAAVDRALPRLTIRVALDHGLARVIVTADPLGLVVGIAVDIVDAAGTHREIVARDALRVALPPAATAIDIEALDGNGNHVWVGRPPPPPVTAPKLVATEQPALWARWSSWAVVGGLAAIGASAFAWREHVAQADYDRDTSAGGHDFSIVEPVETRGRTYAVCADVGFGIAAAAGITAIVLAIGDRDRSIVVAPVTTEDGARLIVTGRF